MLHVKTGDMVKVLSGDDKGKTGKVMQVFPEKNMVVVEGIRKTMKFLKGRNGEQGKQVPFFAPIHASKVQKTEAAAPAKKPAASKEEKAPKKSTKKAAVK